MFWPFTIWTRSRGKASPNDGPVDAIVRLLRREAADASVYDHPAGADKKGRGGKPDQAD